MAVAFVRTETVDHDRGRPRVFPPSTGGFIHLLQECNVITYRIEKEKGL